MNLSKLQHKLKNSPLSKLSILLSALIVLSYPMHTDFPVSHETPQYIQKSIEVNQAFSTNFSKGMHSLSANSRYPLTITSLSLVKHITSLSWPTIIIWLTSITHIAIGFAVASIAHTIRGKKGAAFALILWTSSFTVMRPIQTGWLAQWWSLLPLVLTILCILKHKYKTALGFAFLTSLTHPLSAFILLLSFGLWLPSYLITQKSKKAALAFIITTVLAGGIATMWFIDKAYIFNSLRATTPVYSLEHVLASPLAPALSFAPLGFAWISKHQRKHVTYLFVLTFTFGATFLTFNNTWLGGSFLEWRFEPFFLLALSILGGIGASMLINYVTEKPRVKFLIAVMVIVTISFAAWRHNTDFFREYDGQNPLILYTTEQYAIQWIDENTKQDAHIVTTRSDLNYKWIYILTNRKWTGVNPTEPLYNKLIRANEQNQKSTIAENKFTHFVIFKNREPNLDVLVNNLQSYSTIYENEDVIIKHLNT